MIVDRIINGTCKIFRDAMFSGLFAGKPTPEAMTQYKIDVFQHAFKEKPVKQIGESLFKRLGKIKFLNWLFK